MNALYQRLKELDPDRFEKFCFHLVKDRHPSLDIKRVEGKAGDEGADSFWGSLESGPVVWQCKSFPNGVQKSQKQKIRESLRRAISRLSPRMWILCLSIDMDIKAHRWFERLARSFAGRTEIHLMQASDIIAQLAHRQTLCDQFFPETRLDPATLLALITRTEQLTELELEAVAKENADQLIRRLKQSDARFDYAIIFSTDQGQTQRDADLGAFLSIVDERKTINVYPRDLEALRLDPPRIKFLFTESGRAKMSQLIHAGRGQEFDLQDVAGVSTNLKLMAPLQDLSDEWRMRVRPNLNQQAGRLPVRLTFGSSHQAVVYDFIELVPVRAGASEVELVSSGHHPFRLQLTIPLTNPSDSTIDFEKQFEGASAIAVHKFLAALATIRPMGALQIYSLKHEGLLMEGEVGTPTLSAQDQDFENLVKCSAEVAEYFNIELKLPARITRCDLDALEFLHSIVKGSVTLKEMAGTIVKQEDSLSSLQPMLDGQPVHLKLMRPSEAPPQFLFGVAVQMGSLQVDATATLRDPETVRQALSSASLGTAIEVWFKPVGVAEIRRA